MTLRQNWASSEVQTQKIQFSYPCSHFLGQFLMQQSHERLIKICFRWYLACCIIFSTFFFFQPKEKDSLTFSNLTHKTIPQEAGVLQRQLPTPLCKDNARQIAAAPGYQKADVYMLLVSGSDWKWWPHGHAGGASQPQGLPSWWCWNEQLWKSSDKWVSPRIILTGVTILSVPGRKQRSSKLTWRKFSIMCVCVLSRVWLHETPWT